MTTLSTGRAGLPGFDELIEFRAGERAVAVKNIAGTLPVFATHFPRRPVLPGVLLLELMGELSRAIAGPDTWRLAGVSGLRLRHFVTPGDRVEITTEVSDRARDSLQLRATARVDGRIVAVARGLTLQRNAAEEEL